MNKFVIYTAVIGQYDEILQPKVIDPRFDYILFSNDIHETSIGVWQIRHFSYHNDIQTKIARWIKTHPEQLLPEYEASLWMDANISICHEDVYTYFIHHFQNGTLVATMKHKLWDCAYDEIFWVLCCRFEQENIAINWGHKLRLENYPKHNGLCETGILFRNHRIDKVKAFDMLWWWCINSFSRRDQFSINYALWKTGLLFSYFISENENVYSSPYFSHIEHGGRIPQLIQFKKNEGWLIRYSNKHQDQLNFIRDTYYKIYGMRHPNIAAFILGQYYRIKHLVYIYTKKTK